MTEGRERTPDSIQFGSPERMRRPSLLPLLDMLDTQALFLFSLLVRPNQLKSSIPFLRYGPFESRQNDGGAVSSQPFLFTLVQLFLHHDFDMTSIA